MDICSVVDRTYLKYYATLLASIAHNNPGRDFRFHLLWEGDADQSELDQFNGFCSRNGLTVNFIQVDGSAMRRMYDLGTKGRIPHSAYFRMLIPEILPYVRTALYLDVDMVVIGPLDELIGTNLSNVGAGVVIGYGENKLEPFGVSGDYYFNSGMMLMNLDYWRQHRIGEKALRFATEHPTALTSWDQCALNVALLGQVKYLDAKWNCTRANAKRYATLRPTIVHYAGRTKPWDRPWRLPYGIYYANYSQATPWPVDYFGGERSDRSLRGILKRAILGAHRVRSRAGGSLRAWSRR